MAKKLKIKYVKSAIGYEQSQKDTVRSLGLRKLQSEVIVNDTPAVRGMVFKIRHLLKVEEVEA
ncbi:MAG TPA: 50S ribosomal protein L30 [Aggregatilineales bacterium]|jgi:large subunit ribosomal protein L30|nr:50S ribosomal protein L30 [Anaerolineae bacterium]HUN09715.1 50S ribosomal protein L30 [Aggregatilineales bacterium]